MRLIDADDFFRQFSELDIEPYNNVSTIEVEEHPKGKWEFVQYDANPNIGNWRCTNCRGIAIAQYNFCPTCGADMRGDV